MARNAEKAMTTLARWRAAQLDTDKTEKKRRPFNTSECEDLADAEKFRLDIIREISRKVTQIQNAGLGEFKIRDLNDHINKLLREKRNWEYRIAELGGINFKKHHGPMFDQEGLEVPGSRGYKYFGAAKDLPGVRELFSQPSSSIPRKTRAELMRDVDPDYYGFRDEDDGVILPLEQEAEKEARQRALETEGITDVDSSILAPSSASQAIYDENEEQDFVGPRRFVSHVPSVPSQQEVQQELLRRKKQELMEAFGVS